MAAKFTSRNSSIAYKHGVHVVSLIENAESILELISLGYSLLMDSLFHKHQKILKTFSVSGTGNMRTNKTVST